VKEFGSCRSQPLYIEPYLRNFQLDL